MPRKRRRQRQPESELPIRQLREDADLTQEQLAVYVGVAVSSIRRWEKGDEPTMTVWQMRAFCRAVNISFDDLPDYLSRKDNSVDRPPVDSDAPTSAAAAPPELEPTESEQV
jgi:DNA-binding XRE family transcriptional regulator